MKLRNGIFAAAILVVFGAFTACVDDVVELDPGDKDPPNGDPETPENGDPEDERESALFYLSELQVAAVVDGEATCCVDLNGDDAYDNNVVVGFQKVLATLVRDGNVPGAVGGDDASADIDVEQTLNELLEGVVYDGSLTVLFGADEFPVDLAEGGEFTLEASKANSTSDFEDRIAGDGLFEIEDALTSLDATLEDGIVDAKASSDLVIPLQVHVGPGQGNTGPEGGHIVSQLEIAELSVRLEVEEDESGRLRTTTNTADEDGNPVNYLAGAVRGESTVDTVNQFISGFCKVDDFLAFSDDPADADGTTPRVTADADVVAELIAHSDSLCQGLGGYADKADKIAELFDVDTDGNGVNDAMSVGFTLQLAAATLGVASVEPQSFYLNGLKAPNSDGQGNVPCCYDFNNDEAYDNGVVLALERMIGLLASDYPHVDLDIEEESAAQFSQMLEDGLLTLVVQVTDLQENDEVFVELFEADSVSDWALRNAGDGEFTLADSLGAETAVLDNGQVNVSVDALTVPWSIEFFGDLLEGEFNVSNAQLSLQLEKDADGNFAPVAGEVDGDGNAINFVAGVAAGTEVVDALNLVLKSHCDVSEDYLAFAPATAVGEFPVVTADADVAQDLIAVGGVCTGFGHYQSQAHKIGELFDGSTQDDGILDGMTVGFNLSITGATILD